MCMPNKNISKEITKAKMPVCEFYEVCEKGFEVYLDHKYVG